MSSPVPASRRSGLSSHRFNPLKVLQPKRRLQQILASKPASGKGAGLPGATAPVAITVPTTPAFDYCRFIELDYVPMEAGYMVSMRPTKGYASTKSPSKGYASTASPDRHSLSTHSPSTPRSRRTSAPPSNRDPYGNASVSSSSNSSSCKGSDCSPTKGRHQKYTSCMDSHGIKPPPPEQYLTPLQQKEVCIRHLRARLKETINTLQDRDTEIDELRGQLYRMQEEWVEEECHRVEAQLALREARHEIQQLKQAVDTVRARLSDAGGISGDMGVQKYFQDINTQNHKLENLLLNMELAQARLAKEGEAIPGCRNRVVGSAPASVSGESPGGLPKPVVGVRSSCSCEGSPAHSLTRSSTYTKLSDQTLVHRKDNGPDFPCLSGEVTQDGGLVCRGESSIPSRADLLLEAAFLSEETASLLSSYTQTVSHSLPSSLPNPLPQTFSHTLPHSFPHNLSHSVPHTLSCSSTNEKMCTSEQSIPFHCGLGGMGCMSHPCLSLHHLYLHPLREMGIQTESCPVPTTGGYPSDLDTIEEQRTFRSQACSPTSTWMSDEGEGELESVTTTTSLSTATVMSTSTEPILGSNTPLLPPLPRSATVAFSIKSPLSEEKEGVEQEEKQEREKREKEFVAAQKEGGTTMKILPEEGTQMVTGGGYELDIHVELATRKHSAHETSEGTELASVDCDIEGRQVGTMMENVPAENKQQEASLSVGSLQAEVPEPNSSYPQLSGKEQPHTSQPRRSTSHEELPGVTLVVVHDENDDEDESNDNGTTAESSSSNEIQKSYWSRHFLVDLLAVAIPVVPTVAWLCRGPARGGEPIYHLGSLLRGCCTVALHSLRRGGGLRHYPAGGGDLGGSLI